TALLTLSGVLGSLAGMLEAQQQLAYVPALALLIGAGWVCAGHPRKLLWLGAAAFAVALVMHAADLPTCALTQGHGTHWLWHICNGLMLTLLVTALPIAKRAKGA
ncbi:MAG: hypothetical protein MUC96_28085, partial [Myxococcaceae bacterium]|nr:hypothetical protein [Myxococcaceae bacterium]